MTTLIIQGNLKTRAALHVGAGMGNAVTDALLRRTAGGEIVIPGAALGGALRALATRLAPRLKLNGARAVCKTLEAQPNDRSVCGCPVCHLFGEFYPQAENMEATGGRASRLWVADAALEPSTQEASTHIRDGVGIDRSSGAAARQGAVKFDLEVLPSGACFALHLELEDATPADEQLLAVVLAEWQAGRGAIGGRVARGLGAFTLEDLKCRERNLADASSLMAYLRGTSGATSPTRADWLSNNVAAARAQLRSLAALQALLSPPPNPPIPNPQSPIPYVAQSWLELELSLQATGPLLVNDPTRAGMGGFNHAPLVERDHPVIPGASLRGVLRSHAERIARTLATENGANFLQHCPACNPVARPAGKEDVAMECCDALLQRREDVNLRNPDQDVGEAEQCLACRLFGSPRLGSRLIVEDACIKEGAPLTYKVQDFLAIDRFTGGGRDGAKFDALALWKPTFTARLLLENPRDWELGWLALVLRDLAEGWLTVGFGAAKGFGKVKVPEWTARLGFVLPEDFPVNETPDSEWRIANGVEEPVTALYQVVTLEGKVDAPQTPPGFAWSVANAAYWQAQINTWIGAFKTQVNQFERNPHTLPLLRADNYFEVTCHEGVDVCEVRDNRYYLKAGAAWKEVFNGRQ
ncbi:MAG: hypothetical protein JXA21_00180 [Anaerolineae bacterium]|nr:hypothetical protein [Anaerolineae bacterium]